MIITREEWRKWAESLNPGDKVIVKYGDMLRIGTVKKSHRLVGLLLKSMVHTRKLQIFQCIWSEAGIRRLFLLMQNLPKKQKCTRKKNKRMKKK